VACVAIWCQWTCCFCSRLALTCCSFLFIFVLVTSLRINTLSRRGGKREGDFTSIDRRESGRKYWPLPLFYVLIVTMNQAFEIRRYLTEPVETPGRLAGLQLKDVRTRARIVARIILAAGNFAIVNHCAEVCSSCESTADRAIEFIYTMPGRSCVVAAMWRR